MPTIYTHQSKLDQLPKRKEHDHYPTEQWVADLIIDHHIQANLQEIQYERNEHIDTNNTIFNILDVGAGDLPVFGYAAKKAVNRYITQDHLIKVDCVEIREDTENKRPTDVNWYIQDYLAYNIFPTNPHKHTTSSMYLGYDLIIGNPPFNQAEKFIHHSMKLLRQFGRLIFLLPINFLTSKGRYERLYNKNLPYQGIKIVFLCGRPSFTGNGKVAPQDYISLEIVKDVRHKPYYPEWVLLTESNAPYANL